MKLVNAKQMIQKAYKNRYAIAHVNINNLEWTKCILEVAQETNSPLIIGTSEGAMRYMGGIKTIVGMVEGLMEELNITVPVALHLDHGSYEMALKCIELPGYTSVMFDGSHLEFEDNYKKSVNIVKLAKEKNMSVEVEIGTIGGEEDGIVGTGELADPKEAIKMKDLGIDFLAAGIGNIHGPYPSNWKGLSFKTLRNLSKKARIPYVLHGGSGIPLDQVKMAISLGVSKVNINTELQIAFTKGVRNYIEKNLDRKDKGFDPRKVLSFGVENMKATVKRKLENFGSLGKA